MLKQLHLLAGSGIPLLKGLQLLEHRVDKNLALIFQRLLVSLRSGKSLTQAMRQLPSFFTPLMLALIAAGEKSGQLQEVLQELILYYQRQKEFKDFLGKALIYPLLLIASALGVMLFFLIYVLPVLASAYSSLQAQPSTALKLLLQVNYFLQHYSLVILPALLLLIIFFWKQKHQLQRLLYLIPWCKTTHNLMLEARLCKLLALLLNSGISIIEAIDIAVTSIPEKQLELKLRLLQSYLRRGVEISIGLQHTLGLFSPLTEELLCLGASTGYLPQMLEEAAQIAESDLRYRLEKLRELLAPTLLMVAALITAGLVCTVMSPLFDLFSAIPD